MIQCNKGDIRSTCIYPAPILKYAYTAILRDKNMQTSWRLRCDPAGIVRAQMHPAVVKVGVQCPDIRASAHALEALVKHRETRTFYSQVPVIGTHVTSHISL